MKLEKELSISHMKKLKLLLYLSIIISIIGIVFYFIVVYLQYYNEDIFNLFFIEVSLGNYSNWLQYFALLIVFTGLILSELVYILFYIFKKVIYTTLELNIKKIIFILCLYLGNILLFYYMIISYVFYLYIPTPIPSYVYIFTLVSNLVFILIIYVICLILISK
ncbi:MAG: hypothetical protein JXA99_05075 [Candidatus Lokiarchaeota archaeon]|nr:hypothetical protein [Candidatus Lokiarchaeota archaeon]